MWIAYLLGGYCVVAWTIGIAAAVRSWRAPADSMQASESVGYLIGSAIEVAIAPITLARAAVRIVTRMRGNAA
jgi:hypothetical protein